MSSRKGFELSNADRKVIEALHRSFPLALVPDSFKPYAELSRIHKPAGIMMCYFPFLYGTMLVGSLGYNIAILDMIMANAKLLLLCFFMRGAFCTWNDIIDQDIDRQVSRTRTRPVARRATSTTNAMIWTTVQMLLLIGTFALFPRNCFIYAIPFLVLSTIYPFTKRWTHHPQLILGFAFSFGVFLAFPVFGYSISLNIREAPSVDVTAATSLGAAIIFWTLINCTIYAAQDTEDDAKAGVGSTMIYWGDAGRTFLRILGLLMMVSLTAISFVVKDLSPAGGTVYTALTCGGTALGLLSMVEAVDLEDPASCAWWFNYGNVLVGFGISSGLVGEYFAGTMLLKR